MKKLLTIISFIFILILSFTSSETSASDFYQINTASSQTLKPKVEAIFENSDNSNFQLLDVQTERVILSNNNGRNNSLGLFSSDNSQLKNNNLQINNIFLKKNENQYNQRTLISHNLFKLQVTPRAP